MRYQGEFERLGINTVGDKDAFLEDCYLYFGDDWGTKYGKDLASAETSYLFEKIMKECVETNEDKFEGTLGQFEDISGIIIFTTDIAIDIFFERSNNFKPKWHKDVKQIKLDGFVGYYSYKENSIPVFKTYYREMDELILILNKNKLGKLIQHSPLDKEEKEEFMNDIFYMNIQSFSEDEELMERFIDKPTDWLKEKGDEDKQKAYLQERVLIQIFERFEFKKHEEFEGYVVKLKEEDIQI